MTIGSSNFSGCGFKKRVLCSLPRLAAPPRSVVVHALREQLSTSHVIRQHRLVLVNLPQKLQVVLRLDRASGRQRSGVLLRPILLFLIKLVLDLPGVKYKLV
jgi:hypothetical protein